MVIACALLPIAPAHAKDVPVVSSETQEHKDARMKWWREARFGMFIHWGLYAVPAGTYDGKKVGFIGEWIMNRGKIPVARYAEYAKEFNPVKFNAEEWVKIAKAAGMKYIVITAKHHEGFAMYPSKVTPFNIFDATPFKRDPLAELAAACRKEGLKLGFYYSQAQDWHHSGGAGNSWDPSQKGSMDEYIDKIAVPQVREILSNYGEFPVVLWWDTPKEMTNERAEKLFKAVQALKPDIIMNNRLGGGYRGDTETPEQKIPSGGFKDRDWETCMTLNDTWGFKSYDNNWKSTGKLLFNLVDITSKGGNYLLNVGPTAEGVIPQPSVERLAEIGAWMKVNGEAIYGSSPSCFGVEYGKGSKEKDGYGKEQETNSSRDWRCTTKEGKIYFHLFTWPGTKFEVAGMKVKAVKSYLLADPDRKLLAFTQNGDTLSVTLPATAPGQIASVLCIETGK